MQGDGDVLSKSKARANGCRPRRASPSGVTTPLRGRAGGPEIVSSTCTPTANVRLALPLEREELSFERAQAVLTVTGEKVQVDAGAVAGRLQCLNELPYRSRLGFRG